MLYPRVPTGGHFKIELNSYRVWLLYYLTTINVNKNRRYYTFHDHITSYKLSKYGFSTETNIFYNKYNYYLY